MRDHIAADNYNSGKIFNKTMIGKFDAASSLGRDKFGTINIIDSERMASGGAGSALGVVRFQKQKSRGKL